MAWRRHICLICLLVLIYLAMDNVLSGINIELPKEEEKSLGTFKSELKLFHYRHRQNIKTVRILLTSVKSLKLIYIRILWKPNFNISCIII